MQLYTCLDCNLTAPLDGAGRCGYCGSNQTYYATDGEAIGFPFPLRPKRKPLSAWRTVLRLFGVSLGFCLAIYLASHLV